MATIVDGNILDSDCQYICHQCNCVTNEARGLAQHIFNRFPYADIYFNRPPGFKDKPGNIIIRGDPSLNQRYVINILSQLYPGKSKYDIDSADLREKWFILALCQIKKIQGLKSIAFPWMIGCGYAGGNWHNYKKMIDLLADDLQGVADVYIYRPPKVYDNVPNI